MTEKCPTSGYTCVDQLVARADVIAGQALLLAEFAEAPGTDVSREQHIASLKVIAEMLVKAIEIYTDDHGEPPILDHVRASVWFAENKPH